MFRDRAPHLIADLFLQSKYMILFRCFQNCWKCSHMPRTFISGQTILKKKVNLSGWLQDNLLHTQTGLRLNQTQLMEMRIASFWNHLFVVMARGAGLTCVALATTDLWFANTDKDCIIPDEFCNQRKVLTSTLLLKFHSPIDANSSKLQLN